MRRTWWLAPLAGAAALTALVLVKPATAERSDKKESGKSETASLLPISQVVLFSSGVGYFQREGTVEGTQRVDLSFPVQDVNDLQETQIEKYQADIKKLQEEEHAQRKEFESYLANLNVE